MKIISMTDFVIHSYNEFPKEKFEESVIQYAKFLKQPLTLSMFVPCDEKQNPLDEPQMREERNSFDEVDMDYDAQELHDYIKAKEKVMFKGFYKEYNAIRSSRGGYLNENIYNHTVQLLVSADVELTESAIKKLGL